jgi:hypothetical protein
LSYPIWRAKVFQVLDGLVEKHGPPIRSMVREWCGSDSTSGDRQTRQEFALLQCGEYFRDYLLECGGIGEARMERLEKLRDLCFDTLGDPTEADAADIRRRDEARDSLHVRVETPALKRGR